MTLLNKLTIKNLKLNKKRTIVTIIGIMLSVALITAVGAMYSSSIASLIRFETHEKGNFHVAFLDVPKEDLEIFENNRQVEKLFLTQNIGYAKLNSENEYKPYAYIKAFTKDSLENLSVQLVEGKLPENEFEILIPTHLKTNGKIDLKVGDQITLDVGKRFSEGYELTQENPYNLEQNEEIIDTTKKTYKVVGIIERPASNIESYDAPGYTFITYLDENKISDVVDVYTRYTKDGLKKYQNITANLLGVDETAYTKLLSGETLDEETHEKYTKECEKAKYKTNNNGYLIILETNPLDDGTISGLGKVVAIVWGIIVFTSIFCIKNSFDISITEKVKQYGMLKSVGATKKQIKKNVLYEACILGIIGIPLGIMIGYFASFILIIITNLLIGSALTEGLYLQFEIEILPILVAVLLGSITIYFSAIRSARKASKISPIDSIRNSANIKIKSKKLKCPKIVSKIFGIGGEISYKNLKRNKKKYRTTIISITLSVAVFIALYSFIQLAFSEISNEVGKAEYNYMVAIGDETASKNTILELTKIDNINDYIIFRNRSYNIQNPKYTKEYKDYMNNEDLEGYISFIAIGEEPYKKYVKSLGLKYEDIKDKAILIDSDKYEIYDEKNEKTIEKQFAKYQYKKGDILTGIIEEQSQFDLEIGFVTEQKPMVIDNYSKVVVIVSDEVYDKYVANDFYYTLFFDSLDADKLQETTKQILGNYEYEENNSNENYEMITNFYILISIFLYGFIIVITLIGVTNVFNTITTNMFLRRQEFAMLKSIGMTKKEFSRMIRLESIFMGVRSLIFGIPIGMGLSYWIYVSLCKDSGLSYPIPYLAIILSILCVFLLITVIMKYSMKKINKQNTIETIRNENI